MANSEISDDTPAVADEEKPTQSEPAQAEQIDTTVIAEPPKLDKPQAPSQPQAVEGVGHPVGTPTGKVKTIGNKVRTTRKARLTISRVDPWSVMKIAFLFSMAALIITLIATAILWSVIEASGVLGQIQDAMNALLGNADGTGHIEVSSFVDFKRVMGLSMLIGAINVVLITAIATLCSFIYNLSAGMVGGIELTLSEE